MSLSSQDYRLYQGISEESKLEVIPALIERGFTVEEIAEIVKLDVEKVRQAVENLNKNYTFLKK